MALSPVNPPWASSAANSPFCAALPAWKGLVMVPKFCCRPEAWDAPMARALRNCSSSKPKILAAAAVAPMAPMVHVECQPSE